MIDGQLTIDDAIKARDEAIDRVERNANADWAEAAYLACRIVAEQNDHFTTDNVWGVMELFFPQYATHERRAMGAVMRRLVRENIIRSTSHYTKSSRPECHARPLAVWESLVAHKHS